MPDLVFREKEHVLLLLVRDGPPRTLRPSAHKAFAAKLHRDTALPRAYNGDHRGDY